MKEIFNMINQKPEPITILISLAAALLLSVILYGAYRLANTKESYQPQFAVTLVTMALISTVLMDLIQSNLALSLGMLGSLSIVRFRTNIKDTEISDLFSGLWQSVWQQLLRVILSVQPVL